MGQGSGPGLHLPGEVRVLEEQQTKENATHCPRPGKTSTNTKLLKVTSDAQGSWTEKTSAMPNDVVKDSACPPQEQPESSYLQFAPG